MGVWICLGCRFTCCASCMLVCFWLVGLAYFVGCVGFVLLSVCFVWG